MRPSRAGLDVRVLLALVGLVALGSTAMGVVLSAGFHAVGAHHAAAPRLHAPGSAPYGGGAVVVSPPTPPPSANRAQRAAEALTVVSRPHPVVAPRAAAPPAAAQAQAPAPAPTAANPPLPPSSGLGGGSGVQPTDSGGPTTTAHDSCGQGPRHRSGSAAPKPKQTAAAGLRASGRPSTVEAAVAAALATAEHPDPQDTAKPDGSASAAETADEQPDPEGAEARCGDDDTDGDGDANGNGNGNGNGHRGGPDVRASGVTVTAAALDALHALASAPAYAE